MKLRLLRRYLGPLYTIGSLFINGLYFCDTIEDRVRDINRDGDLDDPGEGKVFAETAIPYGKYKVELSMSPKFKRVLPMVLNVKHFTGIRIHKGNTAKDTHGCILPGENKVKGKVLRSEKYEVELIKQMMEAVNRGEDIDIQII
jgi:hypothetical protein